jgi:ribosomal protein S18 acetylase RimI-like enzyme
VVRGHLAPVRYNAPMHVRTLVTADLASATALWAGTEHLAPVPREEVTALLDRDPELVLAAEAATGELVGVVLGSFDGRRGWISRLAVAPAARRSGVGTALVAELERRLASRGCTQVNLLVYDGNEDGRRFWARRGYDLSEEVVLGHRRLDGDGPSGC